MTFYGYCTFVLLRAQVISLNAVILGGGLESGLYCIGEALMYYDY